LQILAVTTDNATSNDMQREELAAMENSFEETNHVQCFNHTLQLSAKALLRPFNPALGKAPDIDSDGGQDDLEGDVNEGDNNDGKKDNRPDVLDVYDVDDDDIDELDDLDADSREELMADAAVVRSVVSKLRQLLFSIIRSTTVALPQWRRYCNESKLTSRNFPRDVVTRWNSTFDMLSFALEYRTAIDAMMANKGLKLRKFELEDEDWLIVGDLVGLLQVTTVVYHPLMALTLLHRDTKMQRSISPKILLALQQSSPLWIG
jgi:hypothetical protein